MSYYFSKKMGGTHFEEAKEKVTLALKEHGFGVITEIDVQATLKKKIDVDFRKYTILGACHPQSAHFALEREPKIGVFLPCNVVVEENLNGVVEVTIVDPIASMQAVENPALGEFAQSIREKLQSVLDRL